MLVFGAATALAVNSPMVGTWEGTTNDLPSVELTIREDNGRIGGAIGFYFQTRGDPELGPNIRYRVDFVGSNEARLRILRDDPKEDNPGSGLKLTRRE